MNNVRARVNKKDDQLNFRQRANRKTRTKRYENVHKLRQLECDKLRQMVPSIRSKPDVDEVTVIEETIKRITELESAVVEKYAQSYTLPAEILQNPSLHRNFLANVQVMQNGPGLVWNPCDMGSATASPLLITSSENSEEEDH